MRCSCVGSTLRHSPDALRVMLAITACVWSCGSLLRLATWRKVAATRPSARTRGRRPVAGSQPRVWRNSALHPVQRRPHRRVVRPQHRPVAVKQRLQRYRLRRRERRVPARAVLAFPVHHPAKADVRAGHAALEHLDEPAPAHPLRKTQRRRAPAVPAVGGAVRRVVAHQVLVQHVVRRIRRRRQSARARQHPGGLSAGGPTGPAIRRSITKAPIARPGRSAMAWTVHAVRDPSGPHSRRDGGGQCIVRARMTAVEVRRHPSIRTTASKPRYPGESAAREWSRSD